MTIVIGYILACKVIGILNKVPIAFALTGVITLSVLAIAIEEDVTVENKAPPFSLTGSDGKEYSLADFKEKKVVVLAWFPKAFTGG